MTNVLAIGSTNGVHALDEVSSNPHSLVGRRAEEGLGHLPQKIDKRSIIERLKAFQTMTFVGTTNLADVEKWLILIEKCFGVIDCPKEKR